MNSLPSTSHLFLKPLMGAAVASTEIAAKVSENVVLSSSVEEEHYQKLTPNQMDALDRILDQTHVLTVRPFTVREIGNFSAEQKKLAIQNFPEIQLTLRQFLKDIDEELKKAKIKYEKFYIVGSASTKILCGTSCKDTDGNFYVPPNIEFKDLRKCIVSYLKSKLPPSLHTPIVIDEFVLRYLTDAKLVQNMNSSVPWVLYGLGSNLDIKFSHQSKHLRHTITPADGFCVDPKGIAHCLHLGKIATKKVFLRGIDEAKYRFCSIDTPQKVPRLIFRLASLLTKAYDLDHFVYPIALQQLKGDFPYTNETSLDTLILAINSYQDRAYKPYNEMGKMLNSLNFLLLLTCCYEKAGNAENKMTFQYVRALAKSWLANKSRKTLQNCANLLMKYPEDGLAILQVIQGIFFHRWLNEDKAIEAYNLEYAKNASTPKMHFRIRHAHGDQHLSLPYSPDEMALKYIKSYQFLYEKYQKSGELDLLRSLSQDLDINNQAQALLPSPQALIGNLIEKFDCFRVEAILRERFSSKKTSVFFETLQKSLTDPYHAPEITNKLLLNNLSRCQQEAKDSRQKDVYNLIVALKQAVQPNSSGQGLEDLLFLLQKELPRKAIFSQLQRQSLIQAFVHICQQVHSKMNWRAIEIRQKLLGMAVEFGLKDGQVVGKCTDMLHTSSQPFFNKEHPEIILQTMHFLEISGQWAASQTLETQRKKLLNDLIELMLPFVGQWMNSVEIDDKREADIIFCLKKAIQCTDVKSNNNIKNESIRFAVKAMEKYQVSSLQMSVMLILELKKIGFIFDKEEEAFFQKLYLKGLSSVFSIQSDSDDVKSNSPQLNLDSGEMYVFFITHLTKFFPDTKSFETLCKFDKQTVKSNMPLILKNVLESLAQDHLLLALELYHQKERVPLLPKDEIEMNQELNKKLATSSNRDDNNRAYYNWRHGIKSQGLSTKESRENHLKMAATLLQKFSSEDLSKVQTYTIFIISELTRVLNFYRDKTTAAVLAIETAFNLYKKVKDIAVLKSLEILISQTITQEVLGMKVIEDFYLHFIAVYAQKVELLSHESEERFLSKFLKDPLILRHEKKEEIFESVKTLIEKYIEKGNEIFEKKAAAVLYSLASSSFIPERWTLVSPICKKLLQRGGISYQQVLIDIYTILLKKKSIKLHGEYCVFFNFFQWIERPDLYKPIWKEVVATSPNIEGLREACARLNESVLIADAFVVTNKKDATIFQQLVGVAKTDSSAHCLPLIVEAIQENLAILVNDSNAFEKLLSYFKAVYRNFSYDNFSLLEAFWECLKVSPILSSGKIREELLCDFMKSNPYFLHQAYIWIDDSSNHLTAYQAEFFNILVKLPYSIIKALSNRMSSPE